MARIAFVQNITYEYLGVMYISAMLKQHNHQVEVFLEHGQGEEKLLAEVIAFKPDVVGFPCTTGVHLWALKFAGLLKDRCKILTAFGGPHPTFFPEMIEDPAVDIVCRGEGEYPLLELADRLDAKMDISSIQNFWVKGPQGITKNDVRPLVEDLDTLPFPDRELYIGKYPFLDKSQKAFIGGRGCPFECSYCFNHALIKLYRGKGKFVRWRSVENLVREIREVRAVYKFRSIFFQDDTFILNKKWFDEFSEVYPREVGISFVCLIRADLADEGIVRNLKQAGCKNVFFGLESGSEKSRNLLLKKRITDEQICHAAALLKKYRIKFRTYNMLGLPEETLEDAFATVRLNVAIKTDYPWCALFQPYPGTELGDVAKEKKMLSGDEHISASFFQSSLIESPNRREFENLQKLFFYAVRFPFLIPLIRRLIKLPPNPVFMAAFLAAHGWGILRSEDLDPWTVFNVGVRNLKNFFFQKN